MAGDRPRYGLLLSAAGAIVLAVSVFLPWYGVSITADGIAFIQRVGNQFAAQFGNAQLQNMVGGLHADLGGLVGHQVTAVSAHQALTNISVLLLIVATAGILLALSGLARPEPGSAGSHGGPIALLGALAVACVLYRLVDPPSAASSLITLSLREGAWLALLGSLAMLAGGLFPHGLGRGSSGSERSPQDAWSELSGWTPGT
jgi:hypothetical protein